MPEGSIVIVGGSSGLGRAVAQHYADAGHEVVVTSRSAERANVAAGEIGGATSGLALDLAKTETIRGALEAVGPVAHVALVGLERDATGIKEYDVLAASGLILSKLVGYTETVSALLSRMSDESSVVLFGGSAKDRPYPGSTGVTTANGGVSSLVKTMAVEIAPIRVNAIHPSPVGDSPVWLDKPQAVLDGIAARTPTGRMILTEDVVDGVRFLFENRGVNGIDLPINGGFLLM